MTQQSNQHQMYNLNTFQKKILNLFARKQLVRERWIIISQLTQTYRSEILEAIKDLIVQDFLFFGGYYFELNDSHDNFRVRKGCVIPAKTKEEQRKFNRDEIIIKKMKL